MQDPAKIVQEYTLLFSKSSHLFSALRDLPPNSPSKHFQPYFQRTFEIYTKLWKFQQQHRSILENKQYYGLKRCEIGEIASKVGQLYYHYYLRTSETNYLKESFVFYEAISERSYFKDIREVKEMEWIVKQLRYYARFIVVALLLDERTRVDELIAELKSLMKEYNGVFKASEMNEWLQVVDEVDRFISVETGGNYTKRLKTTGTEGTMKLNHAVLVASQAQQSKFSDLPVDLFRMLQSIERLPNEEGKRANPAKFILYRPSITHLLLHMATALKEINEGALLVYISAESEGNGVLIGKKKEAVDCLHCSDLLPFLRKPTVIVVEGTATAEFVKLQKPFETVPIVVLLGPVAYPQEFSNAESGGVYTLFLHAPSAAFALIYSMEVSEELEDKFDRLFEEVKIALKVANQVDTEVKKFMQDDFLCQFIVRHCMCWLVLSEDERFSDESQLFMPSILPKLPIESLKQVPSVTGVIHQLHSLYEQKAVDEETSLPAEA